MGNHGMGHAKGYFSLFAVEAFSVLHLILVVSPLIILHLHGENASQHLPRHIQNTHHTCTM